VCNFADSKQLGRPVARGPAGFVEGNVMSDNVRAVTVPVTRPARMPAGGGRARHRGRAVGLVPAYYLGRPATWWITAIDTARRRAVSGDRRAAARLVRAFRRRTDRAAGIRESTRLLLTSIGRARKPPAPTWLDAVREHVAEHWAEPLALDELADIACVHRVYLSHAFHHFFGQTLSGYLRTLRLFHAAELMRSKADLTEIAIDCGFFDQSHFTHAFQHQHRVSPGQYRRAIAEADSS